MAGERKESEFRPEERDRGERGGGVQGTKKVGD